MDLVELPVESSEVQLQKRRSVSSGSQVLPVKILPVVRQSFVTPYKRAEVTRCPWQEGKNILLASKLRSNKGKPRWFRTSDRGITGHG